MNKEEALNILLNQFVIYNIPHENYDCSEIAEDMEYLANQLGLEGKIYSIQPKQGHMVKIFEYNIQAEYTYHEIFVIENLVLDPRLSPNRTVVNWDEYKRVTRDINNNNVKITKVV